jgi:hypothetical protein
LRRGREGSGTGVARDEFFIAGFACGISSAFRGRLISCHLWWRESCTKVLNIRKSLRSSIIFDGIKNFEKGQILVLKVYGYWFRFIGQEMACLSKNRTKRNIWWSQNSGAEALPFVENYM